MSNFEIISLILFLYTVLTLLIMGRYFWKELKEDQEDFERGDN
jgi:hypothetical protein